MSRLVQDVLVISLSGRRSGISFPQMGSVKQSRAGLNSPKGRKEACAGVDKHSCGLWAQINSFPASLRKCLFWKMPGLFRSKRHVYKAGSYIRFYACCSIGIFLHSSLLSSWLFKQALCLSKGPVWKPTPLSYLYPSLFVCNSYPRFMPAEKFQSTYKDLLGSEIVILDFYGVINLAQWQCRQPHPVPA